MKLVAQLTVSIYLGGGLLAWSAFCVSAFVKNELAETADHSARVIWWSGCVLVWGGAILAATALLTAAASVTWRALGG